MEEEFNIAQYELLKNQDSEYYTKTNGDLVFMWEMENYGYFQQELIHQYPYYYIYKEFYLNRKKKLEQKTIGSNTFIDNSFYWDENGNLTIVDENKKFGKIKVDDIMKIIEKLGLINLKTGAGWYRFNWGLEFSYELFFF